MTACEENKCTDITYIQCSVESVNDLKKKKRGGGDLQ